MVAGYFHQARHGQHPPDRTHRRQTVITPPPERRRRSPPGILAGGTNGGTFQTDDFTVIPQLGLELGYQVNCHWRAYVGYDLLYWATVVKAADQVDLNVDPRNFPPVNPNNPGLPFPAYPGRESSFCARGKRGGRVPLLIRLSHPACTVRHKSIVNSGTRSTASQSSGPPYVFPRGKVRRTADSGDLVSNGRRSLNPARKFARPTAEG